MSDTTRCLLEGQHSYYKLQAKCQTPPSQTVPRPHPTQALSSQVEIMERREPGLGFPKLVLSEQTPPW